MKLVYLFFFLSIVSLFWQSSTVSIQKEETPGRLAGVIRFDAAVDPIPWAQLTLLQKENPVASLQADKKGVFSMEARPGVYVLRIAAKGCVTTQVVGIPLSEGQTTALEIYMQPMVFSEKETTTITYRYQTALSAKEHPEEEAMARSAEKKSSLSLMDRMAPDVMRAVPYETRSYSGVEGMAAGTGSPTAAPPQHIPLPNAGQITAGEWKDLEHWAFWNKLMKDEYFQSMQNRWGFHPQNRYTIQLRGASDQPLIDYPVALVDGDQLLWEGRTDNQGHAELWGHFFQKGSGAFKIRLGADDDAYFVPAKPYDEEVNFYKLPIPCQEKQRVDIAFVVDATGSMGDEINYLKAELLDVMNRVKEEQTDVQLRLASLFYRDVEDRYLTNRSPFTDQLEQATSFVQQQQAAGGGDYPEAVHTALHEAVHHLDWEEEALSRILFLILDAPPHQQDSVLQSIQQDVQLAAKKGIQIIPVAASGVNKKTEFLMKFLAMATNGTYVFITDHSGIGHSHIKPEAEDYNIETLNDLMIRLILERVEVADCEPPVIASLPPVDEQIQTLNQQAATDGQLLATSIQYFPNPATSYVRIELEEAVDELQILKLSGQVIRQRHNLQPGTQELRLDQLTAGTYILRFQQGGRFAHKKLVVVRS